MAKETFKDTFQINGNDNFQIQGYSQDEYENFNLGDIGKKLFPTLTANREAKAELKRSEAALNAALAASMNKPAPQEDSGMSMGAIIGISVGLLAVLGTGLYFAFRK